MNPTFQHFAIRAKDPSKLAEFYKTVFGMREVFRQGDAVYLSEGTVNLALLPVRDRTPGLYHFGFQVESIDAMREMLRSAGASSEVEARPQDGRFAEFRVHDPEGNPIDLAESGWKLE